MNQALKQLAICVLVALATATVTIVDAPPISIPPTQQECPNKVVHADGTVECVYE